MLVFQNPRLTWCIASISPLAKQHERAFFGDLPDIETRLPYLPYQSQSSLNFFPRLDDNSLQVARVQCLDLTRTARTIITVYFQI